MSEVHLLPVPGDLPYRRWMTDHKLQLASKISGITQFEANQGAFRKIFQNAGRGWRNHRLAASEKFKNARRGADLRKNTPKIGHHTDVAIVDGLNNLFQRFRPQVAHPVLIALVLYQGKDLFKVRGASSVDSQFHIWHRLPNPVNGLHRQPQSESFYQCAVIHYDE